MQDYQNSVIQENKMKPRLYTYPNWNESTTVFDFEDLTEENLLILCVRAQIGVPGHEHDQHTVFIWRGPEFDQEEENDEVITIEEFKQRVLESYWGCKNPEDHFNILVQEELFG